uniref:Glutathione S-transferase 1 n=1 Tax=Hadrurus spadix TaxID=141984 RepID=A0A1W7RAF5_9SCOR
MPIDLYMMDASAPCRAVLLTAKYLGIDINKKYLDLMKKEQLQPEFVKINPQHCVPTIDDNGFYLWESRAILTYLVNQYAPDSELYPKNPKKRALVDRLLYFDIGTLYKALADCVYGTIFKGEPRDPEKEATLKTTVQVLEDFLEKSPYVAGDKLSLADISIIGTLSNARMFAEAIDFDFSAFPHIQAWAKKVKEQLPNYQEVTEPAEVQIKAFIEAKKQQQK